MNQDAWVDRRRRAEDCAPYQRACQKKDQKDQKGRKANGLRPAGHDRSLRAGDAGGQLEAASAGEKTGTIPASSIGEKRGGKNVNFPRPFQVDGLRQWVAPACLASNSCLQTPHPLAASQWFEGQKSALCRVSNALWRVDPISLNQLSKPRICHFLLVCSRFPRDILFGSA